MALFVFRFGERDSPLRDQIPVAVADKYNKDIALAYLLKAGINREFCARAKEFHRVVSELQSPDRLKYALALFG
jgi:hypothetical protein